MHSTKCDGLSKNFLADAVKRASPAVVNINTIIQGGILVGMSSGSGFIIDGGYVVTNAHVVERNTRGRVNVTLWDGTKLTGVVHSMDRTADIALIKLDQSYSRLPVAKLGASSELSPGEFVAALGSPLTLKNSVTFGIVSTVSRTGTELGMGKRGQEYIQTDASINSGNSGGPLINMEGEVIGINTMKLRDGDGISFAIPIDYAKLIIHQLQRGQAAQRPYIGLKIATLDGRNGDDSKVVVTQVDPQSPAASAGLSQGDHIISINGRSVRRAKDVVMAVGILDVDSDIELVVTIRRPSGEEATLAVVPSFQ